MKDSFVLYTKYAKHINKLNMEQRGALLTAIFAYQTGDELPEMDALTDMILGIIVEDIEACNAKWEESKQKRAEAGRKGGLAKASNATDDSSKSSNATNATDDSSNASDAKHNVNVNVNVKEKINKKESESEKEFEQLWELYPKKQGKADARKHYLKAKKDGTTFDEVKEGIEAYADYIQKTGTDFQYIKMGSSFFCQRGWESTWDAPEGRASPEEEGGVWHSSLSEEEFNRLCEMHEGPDPW